MQRGGTWCPCTLVLRLWYLPTGVYKTLENSGKREDAGFRIGKGPPGAGADLPKQVSFLKKVYTSAVDTVSMYIASPDFHREAVVRTIISTAPFQGPRAADC